jgi:hypothetical protein
MKKIVIKGTAIPMPSETTIWLVEVSKGTPRLDLIREVAWKDGADIGPGDKVLKLV